MMTKDELNNEYFEWMYRIVCDEGLEKNLSYRKLLCLLHNTEFTYLIERDGDRAVNGIDFRYRFGYECGYSRDIVEVYLDTRPCSVLEMMVSLAFGIEERIMDDPRYGNRTGQWFWNMIVSLGLGSMSDAKFNRRYVEEVIYRFLNRDYEPNGHGGLFSVANPDHDMRTVEIWHQAMWYLNDFIDD